MCISDRVEDLQPRWVEWKPPSRPSTTDRACVQSFPQCYHRTCRHLWERERITMKHITIKTGGRFFIFFSLLPRWMSVKIQTRLTVKPWDGDALKEDQEEQAHPASGVVVKQLEHIQATLQKESSGKRGRRREERYQTNAGAGKTEGMGTILKRSAGIISRSKAPAATSGANEADRDGSAPMRRPPRRSPLTVS